MSNYLFSYKYYRPIPNLFIKQKLREIHKLLKDDLIKFGIENGIIISIFALGCNGRMTEIIYIKSMYRISEDKIYDMLNFLYNKEIELYKVVKDDNINCTISCYGVTANASIPTKESLGYFLKNFLKWENYSVKKYSIVKLETTENIIIKEGELTYVGFLCDNIEIKELGDMLSAKLLEEIFKSQNSVLTEIRNQGLCYTTVSKFHEDLNVVYIGLITSYSEDKISRLDTMYTNVQLTEGEFELAKCRLKKEIIFSTTLYQIDHYLLPFQLLKIDANVSTLLEIIDKIKFEDIVKIFNSRRIVCLKA